LAGLVFDFALCFLLTKGFILSFPFRSIIEQVVVNHDIEQNAVNHDIQFLVDYCDKKRIEIMESKKSKELLNKLDRPFFILPSMVATLPKVSQHNDSRFELSVSQLIQLRSALTNLGIAAPESMEELAFNQSNYIMKMIRAVNNSGNG
jgi:hypothetical protein